MQSVVLLADKYHAAARMQRNFALKITGY